MSEQTEQEILHRLSIELEAQGYDVYIQPNKPLIPFFLENFRPDVIAFREDKNLIVEVIRESPQAVKKLEKIRNLLQGQEKWDLQVVWITQTNLNQDNPQIQTVEMLQVRILEVKKITAAGHFESALLMAWAIFEALARILLTKELLNRQGPEQLIQILAYEGYLTPTEEDRLRVLARKRNMLAHGQLQVCTSKEELGGLISVIEGMFSCVK